MSLFVVSCRQKEHPAVVMKYDPDIVPTMITDSVLTLISDSGVTRYKLEAAVWKTFDKAKEPYWYFPEKFHLERFDDNYNIEATIDGDTAWNYTAKRLWKLKGNVFVRNIQGDEFKTDLLYWDQNQAKLYSEEYIEIKQGDLLLKGYGFESNQEMTVYKISRPFDSAIPFNDSPAAPSDSLEEALPET